MKKIILVVLLASNIATGLGQTLTLTEMIEKTNCSTFSEFNNFVVKKGFRFRTLDTVCCNGYLYQFNSDKLVDTLKDGYVYGTQCQFFISIESKKVSFITRTKANYLPFLTQLEKNYFKVVSEQPNHEGTGIHVLYTSSQHKNIEVKVSMYSVYDKGNNNYTAYYISVIRKLTL